MATERNRTDARDLLNFTTWEKQRQGRSGSRINRGHASFPRAWLLVRSNGIPTDAELLTAWTEGEPGSGESLFERYFDAVYRFFRNKSPLRITTPHDRRAIAMPEVAIKLAHAASDDEVSRARLVREAQAMSHGVTILIAMELVRRVEAADERD